MQAHLVYFLVELGMKFSKTCKVKKKKKKSLGRNEFTHWENESSDFVGSFCENYFSLTLVGKHEKLEYLK